MDNEKNKDRTVAVHCNIKLTEFVPKQVPQLCGGLVISNSNL